MILNIPFGYWRSNVRKFSVQWMLAIHIPVIIVIILRVLVEVGFVWYSFVFLVTAFFVGQAIGATINKHKHKHKSNVTSCLIMDVFRK